MRSPLRQAVRTLPLASVTLAIASPVAAAVTVTLCGPECICIDYTKASGSYIEVRCTGDSGGGGGGGGGGWTTIPPGPSDPPPGGPGSFGGTGNPGSPSNPHPCDAVAGPLAQKLEKAKTWATTKLSWVGPPENRRPTTCTALFRNSRLGVPAKSLLDENAPFHAIFRRGQNCTLPNGQTSPCGSGVAAYTTCCSHSPYVYLCDSFANLTSTDAGIRVIHELLHIAGQREDETSSTGPGDPPTSNQLNDLVRVACVNPQVIPLPEGG